MLPNIRRTAAASPPLRLIRLQLKLGVGCCGARREAGVASGAVGSYFALLPDVALGCVMHPRQSHERPTVSRGR